MEAGSDGILRAQDFLLHGSDIARDIGFLLECRRCKRKPHWSWHILIDFGKIASASKLRRAFRMNGEALDGGMLLRKRHFDDLYAFGGTDLEDRTLRALGCLHAGRKTCGIDLAGISRKLEL